MKNILILGGGGREHALAWKISQSPLINDLFVAPGNGGTKDLAKNIDLDILNFEQIAEFVDSNSIHIIIVGPEAPLVEGIYDYFKNHKVKILGPDKMASQLEGSKHFANEFMKEFNIPTAGYLTIHNSNIEAGYKYIDKQPSQIVLKADGLAGGKGVLILDDKEVAKKELNAMLNGKFGKASEKVVIEEFLDGIEFSVFVLTDGRDYKILPVAKDYKRIGENDTGLNTGGMGAISPVGFVDSDMMIKVENRIIKPTIEGLQKRGYDYKGFIFLGLIKVENDPYVIEYNCRLGDPETEVVLPRIKNDFLDVIVKLFDGSLATQSIDIDERSASTIMLVSGGYPEAYEKGKLVSIQDGTSESILFHAGTKVKNNELLTNGGRVMAVTSYGENHIEAVQKSKKTIEKISFDKMYFRKDIGFDVT